ncbi:MULTISPECIES: ABC transporter ATP-binding protein [unclassified Oceanispirochaeta]|uniref:ABC transporter ATP-binding protein n=1 Tax=unclassified Oceanispirochaeta TaxID=2635722 RepID=UPI000E09B599|nr:MULTISPECIES: ABC transporter ATP-binding protein [unclassified Oceanispirochaeta]MBF9014025.1 ABC transporter ATP-binding protein [Oceanispirochaeta sp. M2]NPD70516.1 ABC transporter ATP-binding protein [Oceanispirochaeta sp. M1]RDG34284.1 ABC transporter ATP-binding protein [Oceanispirochaeta sp. M1]
MQNDLLQIKNLKVSFRNDDKSLQVIRGVDTRLSKGKITGVLGESGSGKTVSFSSILGLLPSVSGHIDEGEVLFHGKNLLELSEKELRTLRGRSISYIFQNPALALNPYKSIGRQMTEMLRIHRISGTRSLILETLENVGLEDPELIFDMYPYQLSGGQSQRILIAMGIILKPELLIADEPTSSIDSSLRKKILDLFKSINRRSNMSILVITHDFDIVEYLCHNLIIMYGGLVLEEGSVEEILHNPLHPYTKELISCTRSLNSNDSKLYSLPGSPLNPHDFSNCCPFYDRCSSSQEICSTGIPQMVEIGERRVRCYLTEEFIPGEKG